MIRNTAAALLFCIAAASPAISATDLPAIPGTESRAWPGGAMLLDVDASDTQRRVYRITQTIPLPEGLKSITLLYPEWEPGHHAPRGPLAQLADLRFTVDGKLADWRRDPLDPFAFRIDLPDGTREVVAHFIHTPALQGSEGKILMTGDMLDMNWEHVSLYPAGFDVQHIRVRPSATFAEGWTAASALDGPLTKGNRLAWAETDYETLVDSPVFAGKHAQRWLLGGNVALSAFAAQPGLLAARAEDMAGLVALREEATALFGRPPFDRYEFLVALSDELGVGGIEHRRSAEIGLAPAAFTDWATHDWARNVIAHEYVHAWNGKYRLPRGLATSDYRQPMDGRLLWLYEGQTQFWGHVLSSRSGLQSKDMVLAMIASQAGFYSQQPGRGWRSLEDTGFDPVFAARRPKPYASLARGEDYYNEGLLVWLEADQIIRTGTRGKRGLDDFARAFFAVADKSSDADKASNRAPRYRPYDEQEIATALSNVYPYDWAGFLRQRFGGTQKSAPLAGIAMGGYRLVWKDEPNPYDKARMTNQHRLDLTFSLGITVEADGDVVAPQWGSPAVSAGIVTGARIIAVDGLAYGAEVIKAALTAAKGSNRPIELLVRRGDRYATVPVQWNGGLRWPWLEKAQGSGITGLDRLLAPRRNAP